MLSAFRDLPRSMMQQRLAPYIQQTLHEVFANCYEKHFEETVKTNEITSLNLIEL
jgi:hypothetical protein